MANEFHRENAIKRGRGMEIISLDVFAAEALYGREPANLLAPDKMYERQCACALLERSFVRLRQDYTQSDGVDRFEMLVEAMKPDHLPYATYADKLNMSENAVKVAVHRLRLGIREAIKAEVAQTVASPDEIEDEIRHLFVAVGLR